MANIQITLDEPITTDFTVFAPDQVLTASQLNTVASYADDQSRLTRVNLLGVGVACGLRVTLRSDNTISVSKGVGVTTDGDILYLEGDTVFSQYKDYDTTNPVYSFFYQGTTMIPAYQLLPAAAAGATADPKAVALTQFAAETSSALGDMVAVLFMESYVNAAGICTGTDCDNMGQDCTNTMKLLLVDQESAALLQAQPGTLGASAGSLAAIAADRVLLTSSITTYAQLAAAYTAACSSIRAKLAAALPKLYPACSSFLAGVFPGGDPSPAWNSLLAGYAASFGASTGGIQYFYDFLKDVVDTHNGFIGLLYNDETVCCPAVDTFPKHLLLGNLTALATAPDENRTPFFPSPATASREGGAAHAGFLAAKLDTLIRSFALPATGGGIRITPSGFEDLSLEDRAIPFYYNWSSSNQIQQSWSYRLSQQGLDAQNYSYFAASYGGNVNAFGTQIGRYPFFRIEGHLGLPISSVESTLTTQIQTMNIPIAVRKILLWTDTTVLFKPPGLIHYTPLHDFHYVLRQDTYYRADDVKEFSSTFKGNVTSAIADKVFVDAPADNSGANVSATAAQSDATIEAAATSVQTKLNLGYSSYIKDPSWKSDYSSAILTAGQFKANLGSIAKTQFSTPFDSAIASNHPYWLEWLDQIIQANEAMEEDKLLFSNFVTRHPGLEHFGGSLRGGTLVLVYDNNQTVVADFMVPYFCEDNCCNRPEPAQPLLPKPVWKPDWVVQNGLTLNEKIDNFVGDQLTNFHATVISPEIAAKVALQGQYLVGLKDSVNLFTSGAKPDTSIDPGYTDKALGDYVIAVQAQRRLLTLYNQNAADPTLTAPQRAQYSAQAVTVQGSLAQAVQGTLQYISTSGADVSPGTDAFNATMTVSTSVPLLTDATAAATLNNGLAAVQKTTLDPVFRGTLGNVLNINAVRLGALPMVAAPAQPPLNTSVDLGTQTFNPAAAGVVVAPATNPVIPVTEIPLQVVSPALQNPVFVPQEEVTPATPIVGPIVDPVALPGVTANPAINLPPKNVVTPPIQVSPAVTNPPVVLRPEIPTQVLKKPVIPPPTNPPAG